MRSFLQLLFAFMVFSCHAQKGPQAYHGKKLQVIELRNYLISEGMRDNFIDSFGIYIEDSQNAREAYITGKYRVKNADNNFFWIRGFESMPARKKALEGFYKSEYWSKTKRVSAGVVLNYDNVHLLKPLNIVTMDSSSSFDASSFESEKGVMIVDFYFANGRRNEMLDYFRSKYAKRLNDAGAADISYWISEDQQNNYPDLPTFQDKNLLVSISRFDNEKEYRMFLKNLGTDKNLQSIVTIHNTLILFPIRRIKKLSS